MHTLHSVSRRLAAVLFVAAWAAAGAQGTGDGAFEASAPRTHVERITGQKAEYEVDVGGLLDMDNTSTRTHGNIEIAFQNNLSLTIANTGTVPVANPRVITNGRRRWASVDEMLAEFTQGAETDQDRVYLIYDGVRGNRYHDAPIFRDDLHDPVRMLNIYGAGLCDDMGRIGSALYYRLGLNAAEGGQDPFTRTLHGHMMCEVFVDGAYQFMDMDQDEFFLDRENRKPVSGDALVRDHDLARREACYGPTLCGWDAPYRNAALFGIDDGRTAYGLLGHRMDYVLRPGESMVFRWDNVGKYAYERSEGPHRYYGNSKIVYEPALTEGPFEGAAESAEGYAPSANGLVCAEGHGALVIRTDTCYTICGGTATAVFSGGTDGTLFAIASSLDGKEYTPVWRHSGQEARAEAHLDEALGLHGNPPRRTHYVRFSVENGPGSVLAGIRIETDIVAAPLALPRLATGTNQVEYTDTTAAPHEVLITHEWIECSSVVPPRPPETPVSPAPHEILRETYVQFRWPSVPGCSGYHIRVSRRPDMRYAFRPNYDVVVPENGHRVPWRGMFSPGETYYWNVRPRLASGVWGSWSPVWRFEWAGPMVPRGVRLTQEGDEFFLRWEPNPGGTRPVRYDVYGSDERGFSVNRAFHEVPGLGTVPGNFVASTTDTQLRVIGPATDGPGMNRAYYRVVAVDARGVEGCPSDFAEAPRPYVFTRPVGEAAVGQPYSYALDTIRSIGDFQHRYDEPGHAYWEREAYLFAIERGPAWLHVDEATGLLSGTPGADGVGDAEVVVHVTTEYPAEVPVTAKSGEDFQNRRTRPDLKRECRHRFVIHVAG